MADTGKLASFSFNSVVYDEDDCINSWQLNDAINKVIYQCGGTDKGAAGTRVTTFAVSLALAADDVTKVGALVPGSVAAFEAHPAGDTPGYQEVTSTEALLETANRQTSPNGIIAFDLTFHLNDVTLATATT